MDQQWEGFFREKSARRSRRRRREQLMKGAVLVLLVGSLTAAAYLEIAGLPR